MIKHTYTNLGDVLKKTYTMYIDLHGLRGQLSGLGFSFQQ